METVQPVTCRGVKPLRVSADFVCLEEKAVNTRLEIGELSALLSLFSLFLVYFPQEGSASGFDRAFAQKVKLYVGQIYS